MNKYSESYLNNGTAYISIDESPLSNDDLEKLNMFCSEVDKDLLKLEMQVNQIIYCWKIYD